MDTSQDSKDGAVAAASGSLHLVGSSSALLDLAEPQIVLLFPSFPVYEDDPLDQEVIRHMMMIGYNPSQVLEVLIISIPDMRLYWLLMQFVAAFAAVPLTERFEQQARSLCGHVPFAGRQATVLLTTPLLSRWALQPC